MVEFIEVNNMIETNVFCDCVGSDGRDYKVLELREVLTSNYLFEGIAECNKPASYETACGKTVDVSAEDDVFITQDGVILTPV